MVLQLRRLRAEQTQPERQRIARRNPQRGHARTGWNALAKFQVLLTNYIDLFSLAQGNASAHQEYQPSRNHISAFSRTEFLELRKTCRRFLPVFASYVDVVVLISTVSSETSFSQCGFGWKAKALSSTPSFFSHSHQIVRPLLHTLWSHHRLYPVLLARYPKLPQASATTTVFI